MTTIPYAPRASGGAGVLTNQARPARPVSAQNLPGQQLRSAGPQQAPDFVPPDNSFANDITDLSNRMQTADNAIRTAEESFKRQEGYSAYDERVSAEWQARSRTQDMSLSENLDAFGQFMQEEQEKILQSTPGSQAHSFKLMEGLEKRRGKFATDFANSSIELREKKIDARFSSFMTSVLKRSNRGAPLEQSLAEINGYLQENRDHTTTEKEILQSQTGESMLLLNKFEFFLGRGELTAAEDVLESPGIENLLGPKAFFDMSTRLSAGQQAARKGSDTSNQVVVGAGGSLVDRNTSKAIFTAPFAPNNANSTSVVVPKGAAIADRKTGKVLFTNKGGSSNITVAPGASVVDENGQEIYKNNTNKPIILGKDQKALDPDTYEILAEGSKSQEKITEVGGEIDENGVVRGSQFVLNSEIIAAREQGIVVPGKPTAPFTAPDEKAMAKGLGDNDAEREKQIRLDGDLAQREKSELDRLNVAVKEGTFETGSFGRERAAISRFLALVGVPDDVLKEFGGLLGDEANADTIDTATNRLALLEFQSGKSARAVKIYMQTLLGALPSLVRTKKGNEILIEAMDRWADRRIKFAEMSDKFLGANNNTYRPPGKKTFYQIMREDLRDDPIVTEKMLKDIQGAVKQAPTRAEFITGFEGALPARKNMMNEPEAARLLYKGTIYKRRGSFIVPEDELEKSERR